MCLYMLAPLYVGGNPRIPSIYSRGTLAGFPLPALFQGNLSRVPPSPPGGSPELEVDRGCGAGGDGDLLRAGPGLVVERAAVLVHAPGPEAFVPHRDLVAAGREPIDAEGAPLVGHGVVGTVVHH